jgi:DNA primase
MAKKRSRAHQVSKGITHQNPNRFTNRIAKALRVDYRQSDARAANQVAAWRAGKNVMITIPNPDKKNTRERMIRVPAIDIWGFPRTANLRMR